MFYIVRQFISFFFFSGLIFLRHFLSLPPPGKNSYISSPRLAKEEKLLTWIQIAFEVHSLQRLFEKYIRTGPETDANSVPLSQKQRIYGNSKTQPGNSQRTCFQPFIEQYERELEQNEISFHKALKRSRCSHVSNYRR